LVQHCRESQSKHDFQSTEEDGPPKRLAQADFWAPIVTFGFALERREAEGCIRDLKEVSIREKKKMVSRIVWVA